MRSGLRLVATLLSALWVAACGSDEGSDGDAKGAPTASVETTAGDSAEPTECLPAGGDMSTTIKLTVDDPRDGFGSVGSRTPSDLPAGTILVELESSAENTEPLDVPLLMGDAEVFRFVAVEPGTTCGVQLDLAAGSYRVVVGENDAEFAIGE
ncbi:MAG: hypothetical protein ACR2HQ_14380 [Ilumatobacteraceae bacterium]